MTSDEGKSKKRITNACLPCRKAKMRCDGADPICSTCLRRDVICQYTTRKTRGQGKSKEYIQQLEDRIRSLEASLKNTPGSSRENETYSATLEDWQTNPVPTREGSACQEQNPRSQTEATPSALIDTPTHDLPSLIRAVFRSRESSLLQNINRLKKDINPGRFNKTIFTKVLQATPQIGVVIEDINRLYPLLAPTTILELLSRQNSMGPTNSTESPGRWAIVNSFLAILMQWKVENSSFAEFSPLAWAFFKNAYTVLPELLIRGKELLDCQGILFMAMFMHGTADAWTGIHLVSVAGRLAEMMGWNRNISYLSTKPQQRDEYLRTFWVIFIFDITESMKSGLPPSLDSSSFSLPLPSCDSSDRVGISQVSGGVEISLIRCRAELALIQSKIFKHLLSEDALQKSLNGLHTTLAWLSRELEEWRKSLPSEIRPSLSGTLAVSLEIQVIHLHFVYYSCIWKLRAAYTSLYNGVFGVVQPNDLELTESEFDFASLSITCIVVARATLGLMRTIYLQPFTYIWRTICYPITACITLLASILDDPTNPDAELDADLIKEFVHCLKELGGINGCAIDETLAGCSKFLDIVAVAIPKRSGVIHRTDNGGVLREEAERVRFQLSVHSDHMLLAQGLIGNMPSLCREATLIFSGPAGPLNLGEEFGLFVPKLLKPTTFNFEYA
ncbi:hypothetical protein Trisim1_008824 [Trichoderma cf. simile WF8]